jgi:hypothetical protein
MDRDGNLPGFFRKRDNAGSRLGQDNAAIKPRGGFGLTFVATTLFQAGAIPAYAANIAAKG